MPISLKGHESVIKSLTNLQKGQVPFAASWALNHTAFQIREDEKNYMRETFARFSPFTEKSVLYTKSSKRNLRVALFHRDQASKGNAPAEYLAPQVYGGDVFVTRFTRRLQAKFPNDVKPGEYVPQWLPGPGAPPGRGGIQKVLAGLRDIPNVFATAPKAFARGAARRRRQAGNYFFLGTQDHKESGSARRGRGDSGFKGPGIYTRKGNNVALVYSILSKPVSVPAKYEWNEARIRPIAERIFAEKFSAKIDELIRG